MLFRKVQKIKDSLLITLPAQVCGAFGINAGDRLGVVIEDGKIMIIPATPAVQAESQAARTPITCQKTI